MSRLLIIGYGNPFRGDDAAGCITAERLLEQTADPDVEILAVHQLTPELMEPVSRAGRVIFVDAALGDTPGEIVETEISPRQDSRPFSHYASPEALVAGAQALYHAAPRATLITMTAATFELGAPLSAAVTQAVETVIRWIRGCISVQ